MKTFAALILSSLLSTSVGSFANEPQRPNILLIFADDHGYGDVSAYHTSDVRTPDIDRIGRGHVR